jgi:hypothetical protein
MKARFKPINETLNFNPGDIYILDERESRCYDPGPIEYMITVRSVDEIMPAIKLHFYIVEYELRAFIGCAKLSDYSYELKMLSYDPDEGVKKYSLFLHRIKTFNEILEEEFRKHPDLQLLIL